MTEERNQPPRHQQCGCIVGMQRCRQGGPCKGEMMSNGQQQGMRRRQPSAFEPPPLAAASCDTLLGAPCPRLGHFRRALARGWTLGTGAHTECGRQGRGKLSNRRGRPAHTHHMRGHAWVGGVVKKKCCGGRVVKALKKQTSLWRGVLAARWPVQEATACLASQLASWQLVDGFTGWRRKGVGGKGSTRVARGVSRKPE